MTHPTRWDTSPRDYYHANPAAMAARFLVAIVGEGVSCTREGSWLFCDLSVSAAVHGRLHRWPLHPLPSTPQPAARNSLWLDLPKTHKVRPGEVYQCDFSGVLPPEMVKIRPVILMSRSRLTSDGSTILVVPIS